MFMHQFFIKLENLILGPFGPKNPRTSVLSKNPAASLFELHAPKLHPKQKISASGSGVKLRTNRKTDGEYFIVPLLQGFNNEKILPSYQDSDSSACQP